MYLLPGSWHAAAWRSGQLAIGEIFARLDVPAQRADAAAWMRAGAPLDHALALAGTAPLELSDAFLTLEDVCWPAALRGQSDAPGVLFYRGNLGLLAEPCVAMVGTRRPTELGRRIARQLAGALAQAGGVVVSGLAHGIDGEVHTAAEGRTIAVLGQGLETALTSTQRRVADSLLDAGGLVLSEFLPQLGPTRWTFPQRNRVIAGLSRATLVIEAGYRSGALITARRALELGRDVLAVPGHPGMESMTGCLELLSQGARMVRGPAELLHAVGIEAAGGGLVEHLRDGPGFDQIVARTGLPTGALMRALTALELTGLVRRLPGDRYLAESPP